jgi:hypothetical protein
MLWTRYIESSALVAALLERDVAARASIRVQGLAISQPFKLEAVNADRGRPRKIGVVCFPSSPIEAVSSRRETNVLQILAKGIREGIDLSDPWFEKAGEVLAEIRR